MTDAEKIAEFIKRRGVTKCPPGVGLGWSPQLTRAQKLQRTKQPIGLRKMHRKSGT